MKKDTKLASSTANGKVDEKAKRPQQQNQTDSAVVSATEYAKVAGSKSSKEASPAAMNGESHPDEKENAVQNGKRSWWNPYHFAAHSDYHPQYAVRY